MQKSTHLRLARLNDQSGVSLVEVMIASGIGVSLALVMATMTTNMQKSVKGVERSTDWVDLKSTIRGNLLSETKCIQLFNLGATVIDTSPATNILARTVALNLGGTNLAVDGLWGGVRVVTLRLNDIPTAGPQHITTLDVTVSTNRNAAATTPEVMGAQSYNYSFRVAFYAAPTAPDQTLLTRCISAENDTSELFGAINDLTTRVANLETSVGNTVTPAPAGSLLNRMTTAEGDIGALEGWRSEQELEDIILNDKIALMEGDITGLQTQIADLETQVSTAAKRCVTYEWNANTGSERGGDGYYFFACPLSKRPLTATVRPGGNRWDCSGPTTTYRNSRYGMSGDCTDGGDDEQVQGGKVVCCDM